MSALTYTRFEIIRTFRNKRFFVFSLIFPLIMFFTIGGSAKNSDQLGGISVREYYMISMATFGAMMAMLGGAARIAGERSVNWTRQLRLTPLSVRGYFRAKVIANYLMALLSIVLLYVAGSVLGVRMDASMWLKATLLVLAGLIPFAMMAIFLGHLGTADSIGPLMGGLSSLLALVGGAWFAPAGILKTVGQYIPSYWLVQAGRGTVLGEDLPVKAWIVFAVWTVVMGVGAAWAYRRDTNRQ
jgi:ABC-2 type transport system permease protein